MKQTFALVTALFVVLAPLAVAAEPIAIDTTDASPPAPEVTCFEPSESQSTNVTPTFCVNESSTSGPLLSDIMVGCDGSGEYFSESDGSVTVTGTPEPWSVNTSESDYDSGDWNQSIIDTPEEHAYLEEPELHGDTVPDSTATDVTLHASAQPSSIQNITVESEHPYANNYTYTWKISKPGAHQMQLHFDKLSLANGGDTLTIYDDLGRALVCYGGSGSYDNTDFWTAWQTTDTLWVTLVTDNRYTSYGFLIDKIDCRYEKSPSTEHFAESYHSYANNYVHTWKISKPGAHQMQLHFDKLSLANGGDTLTIYDDLGRALVCYGGSGSYDNTDFWTAWQTTDTLWVTLATDNRYTSYGFLIDKVDCRYEKSPPTGHPAESYHSYANNYVYTWNISRSGAHQMRLHFDKLSLANSGDTLTIYDDLGRELVCYRGPDDDTAFWTAWQTTDTLRVRLATDNRYTSYGFLIDKVDCRYEKIPPTEHFAESYHSYANNYVHTWKISMPGANKTRLHFDKLSLADGRDTLTIYDDLGRQLARYSGTASLSYDNTDFWTAWQTTDTLRVTLSTDGRYTSYGFLIDLIETEEGVFTPSQIPAPADLTLHSGWNFISVPRPLAAGNDTALIFTPVETDGRSIFRYDTAAGDWTALDEEDQIAPLEGFWIYSTGPTTVPLNVSTDPLIPPAERVLATGWNAIGITGTTPATARDALFSVSGKWTTLIGFDARRQVFETGIVSGGSKDYVDSRLVYQGKGYWLHMTGPGTLCAVGA